MVMITVAAVIQNRRDRVALGYALS